MPTTIGWPTNMFTLKSRKAGRTELEDDASSLLSYATSASSGSVRKRAASVASTADGSEPGGDANADTRSVSWRGHNSPMPLPWRAQAARAPTLSFDEADDFTPNAKDPYSLRNSEYGYDVNPAHRSTSQFIPTKDGSLETHRLEEEEPFILISLLTYISYALLNIFGHMREFVGKRTHPQEYTHLQPHNGYAPLFTDWDSFYTRRMKQRIDDCFSRPVTSIAARSATLLDRTTVDYNQSFTFTGETTQALNVSSYNYLGFSQSRGPCAEKAESAALNLGLSTAADRASGGTHDIHIQAERLMANFLGTEDAMIVSQGFATNSTTFPSLVSKGCLIISDELNHASIRFGARLSGAMIRSYKHNDMEQLEELLRESISQGRMPSHRPWKKILVIVEGIFSMEGTMANLPKLLELKKKYKFYLYVDEAHSVGALGPRGRGVCDYFGCNPREVDILMGTFTKSFGAAGGYIAGSHATISALRLSSAAENYSESISPVVIAQIITSAASIMGPSALKFAPDLAKLPAHLMNGKEGLDRIQRLAFNCRYLHSALRKLGFIVYGSHDSPIVPLLVFGPGRLAPFSRLMLERHKIIVVLAAYPAAPLALPRIRLCLSSAHTKADLDRLLLAIDDVGTILGLKLSPSGQRAKVEDVIQEGAQLVRDYEKRGGPLRF